MKTVGVTGGIGSGKSTVVRVLGAFGAHVIDADRIGHEVYQPGTEGWHQVVSAFGREIVAADRFIDRKRLAAIVFADKRQLARLNAIAHPLIRQRVVEEIAAQRSAGTVVAIVVEAAVLIEARWTSLVDEVWLVVADRDAIMRRVRAQRGLDAGAIRSRMRAQLSDEDRRRHADVTVDNSGSFEDLEAELGRLWQERIELSKAPNAS